MFLRKDAPLSYLAEGGAHIVYLINGSFPPSPTDAAPSHAEFFGPSTPPPTELEPGASIDVGSDVQLSRMILRLRKDVTATADSASLNDQARKTFKSSFPQSYLLREEEVSVDPALIERLNKDLEQMEADGTRPLNRRHVYLRTQRNASMVEDMRRRSGKDLAAVEIKPKWLVQSPSAPSSARRCRTCALRAMRRALHTTAIDATEAFCPLDLIGGRSERVLGVIETLLNVQHDLDDHSRSEVKARLVDFIMRGEPLRVLRKLQSEHQPYLGSSAKAGADTATAWAMTLRDCTLFLRVCDHEACHGG